MRTKRELNEWLGTLPDDAEVAFLTQYDRVHDEDTIHLISIEDGVYNQHIQPLNVGHPWGIL